MQQAESVAGSAHSSGASLNPINPMNPFTGMLSVWEEAFREAGKLASQNMMAASSGFESATAAARDLTARSAEMPAPNGHHRQTAGRAKRQSGARRKA